MTSKESFSEFTKSPLVRSLAGLLYYWIVDLGLVLLGWGAAGGLQGFFNHPVRAGFFVLLVMQELAAAWIRWRIPLPPDPNPVGWFADLTRERWRFLNQEMIYALAPYSDRRGIAVIPDSEWVRVVGLILVAAAGAWLLWTIKTRREYLQQLPGDVKEPLILNRGPYQRIRFPVMLAVLVNSLGVALVFRSLGGLFLVLLMLATILRRIRWMEMDASKAVPLQWSAYARRSWRLIPKIY